MAATATLCIFAKPPRPGEAKTRLASELGAEGAAALARAFFRDTWASVSALPWARPVLATTDVTAWEWRSAAGAAIWPQGPGNLGARLERVLGRALEESALAIAIGADTPGLPPRLVEDARDALGSADAVLGPAVDGGFYLIGLRRCPAGLLAGLPWSAPDTFDPTLARLRERRLATEILSPWFDVDLPRDLRSLRALISRGEVVAPETKRVLDELATNTTRGARLCH